MGAGVGNLQPSRHSRTRNSANITLTIHHAGRDFWVLKFGTFWRTAYALLQIWQEGRPKNAFNSYMGAIAGNERQREGEWDGGDCTNHFVFNSGNNYILLIISNRERPLELGCTYDLITTCKGLLKCCILQ